MGEVTRWWWVRHAPVTVNNGRCYGQTDHPCDCSNIAAFGGLAAKLPQDAVWITSPLLRTHMTAAGIVRAGLPGPDPIPGPGVLEEPELIEQHFGEWQGKTYAELAEQNDNNLWPRFWLAPAHQVPPGGESFVQLLARAHPCILRLSREHAGRDIIAVTHGGTIRAAVALALDLAPEAALAVTIDNLSVTRIEYFADEAARNWRIAGVNHPPV